MITNTNAAATVAKYNLEQTNAKLQKSLLRLSSGLRIHSAMDDAGGLAVSLKLSAAIRRTDSASVNVGNALSFLQSQDGVLKVAGSILDRMSELATLASDGAKSEDDRELYETEYLELSEQMVDLTEEEFNGIPLFSNPAGTLTVRTSENGSQTTGVSQVDLESIILVATGLAANITDAALATTAMETLDTQIQNLAVLSASNGAQQSRLSYAFDVLTVNRLNLEAANSRIMDADLARESTEYAKRNIISQAGVAMLAQANTTPERALKLLDSISNQRGHGEHRGGS
jgi:flagellin